VGVCGAQQTNRALSPSEIVDRFLKAQQSEQWSEAASYLDLDALERIRQREVENYGEARFPEWTVERFMKEDPSMPRAVAEYEVQRMRRTEKDFDTRRMWRFEFADVDSLSVLKKLTGDELVLSWVKAHDAVYQSRQNKETCDDAARANRSAAIPGVYPKRAYRILGEVVNDSLAYVLKEDEYGGKIPNPLASVGVMIPPETFMLRNVRGTWKLLPFIGRGANVVSIECVSEPASPKK
jgi:hypothetical protein